MLAVNTDESYDEDTKRFWHEVEKAKYISPVPLVGFVEGGGRILEISLWIVIPYHSNEVIT